MKHTLMLCSLLLFALNVNSQTTKGLSVPKTVETNITGKTYALILGVSKYKNPAIPQLQYADRDATAFRNYLVATGVDSNNITLLLNEKATNAEFWASISFLQDVAKKGDKVYIYFSGHGDVENRTVVKDAYLLPYDAPKCVYPAGAIAVLLLKSWIATLSAGGIQAIFIADACRSGNLAGGREGMEAAAAMLKENWQDEIKILSCQPGELSLEGKQWGGGRGLFSYELINGMAGAADKNKDGKVTLRELNLYMMEKVPDEATPLPQNPALYGNMETIVSVVSPGLMNEVASDKNTMLARVDVKGFEESLLAGLDDSIKYNYKLYKAALDTGNYLDGKRNMANGQWEVTILPSAYYYYMRMPDNDKTHLLLAIMKRNICSAIMEDADKLLNGNFSSQFISLNEKATLYARLQYGMPILRNILGDKKLNDYGFLPKLYTFETLADLWNWRTHNDTALVQDHINALDSAIVIAPAAGYLYYIRGEFYAKAHKINYAIEDYKKTISLSPRLIYTYYKLNFCYASLKMDDLMIDNIRKLLVLDSNLNKFYNDRMAMAFAHLGKKDSAYKYINMAQRTKGYFSFEIDPLDSVATFDESRSYFIACAYSVMNEKEQALKFLEQSIAGGYGDYIDVTEEAGFNNIQQTAPFKALIEKYFPDSIKATAYLRKGENAHAEKNYTLAEKYLQKAIEYAPTDDAYLEAGKNYRDEKKYIEAENCFKKVIEINPGKGIVYISYAKLYIMKNDTSNALSYLETGFKKGVNYSVLKDDDLFYNIVKTSEYKALMKKYFPNEYKE